jgi:hypothetical protein
VQLVVARLNISLLPICVEPFEYFLQTALGYSSGELLYSLRHHDYRSIDQPNKEVRADDDMAKKSKKLANALVSPPPEPVAEESCWAVEAPSMEECACPSEPAAEESCWAVEAPSMEECACPSEPAAEESCWEVKDSPAPEPKPMGWATSLWGQSTSIKEKKKSKTIWGFPEPPTEEPIEEQKQEPIEELVSVETDEIAVDPSPDGMVLDVDTTAQRTAKS